MKLILSIYCSLIFVFGFAQKKDSVLEFYNFNPIYKNYEKDFEKKLKSDSTLYKSLDSLKTIGYYTLRLDSVVQQKIYFNKGKMYKNIWVKNDTIFNQKKDWIPIQNLDSLIQKLNQKYAAKGYPFTEIKIKPLGYKEGEAMVELELKLFAARTIDGIQLNGYEKLSKGYIKHGLGLKLGKVYNEEELKKVTDRILMNPFVEETRPAQSLFNPDSTTIYLYVKKVKSNVFDGILGFGNDQNGDFRLNGNVKVELNNNFNAMEQIKLNWISTADKNTSLDLDVRIPYLFKSAIGSQSNLSMYKQDSVFVNTKFEERLFYQLTLSSNLGVNLSYENSSFVLDENPQLAMLYDDFDKTGIGISYEYFQPIMNPIFEGKTKFYLVGKTLNRTISEFDEQTFEYSENKSNQYEVGFNLFHLFRLHPKHYLKTRLEGFGLFGNDDYYAVNELYRIGGFNSIRGFNEESISASTYGISSLEYRFVPNDGFYISAFADYGFIENKSADLNENLLGTGLGFSFLTQLGIFNLSYAVGKQSESGFDFKNAKIHFGILAKF